MNTPNVEKTRTKQTEERYLLKALWFEGVAAASLGQTDPTPQEVAVVAIDKKGTWSRSTWRQIKASLIFRFTAMGTSTALEAVKLLNEQTQEGCLETTQRTSGARLKSVPPEKLEIVLAQISKSNSQYASGLAAWLRLGSITGLRPHEWCHAEIVMIKRAVAEGRNGSSKPVADGDEIAAPFLRIANGKATNDRSHGTYRHLDLSTYAPESISAISGFAASMRGTFEAGDYDRFYMGCQKLLDRCNQRAGMAENRRVQIYSARHIFSSNAKKTMDRRSVAALMGHATDATAQRHYGLQRPGAGGTMVTPLATEVAKVREIRSRSRDQAKSAAPDGAARKLRGLVNPTKPNEN